MENHIQFKDTPNEFTMIAIEGTHEYRICSDVGSTIAELNETSSDNCVIGTFTVFPDGTPPAITISSPVAGVSTRTTALGTISGNATDNIAVTALNIAIRNVTANSNWNGFGWNAGASTTFNSEIKR